MLVPRIERRAQALSLMPEHKKHAKTLKLLIARIHDSPIWGKVTAERNRKTKTSTTQHLEREPSDDVDHTGLPNSTSLEHLLALTT